MQKASKGNKRLVPASACPLIHPRTSPRSRHGPAVNFELPRPKHAKRTWILCFLSFVSDTHVMRMSRVQASVSHAVSLECLPTQAIRTAVYMNPVWHRLTFFSEGMALFPNECEKIESPLNVFQRSRQPSNTTGTSITLEHHIIQGYLSRLDHTLLWRFKKHRLFPPAVRCSWDVQPQMHDGPWRRKAKTWRNSFRPSSLDCLNLTYISHTVSYNRRSSHKMPQEVFHKLQRVVIIVCLLYPLLSHEGYVARVRDALPRGLCFRQQAWRGLIWPECPSLADHTWANWIKTLTNETSTWVQKTKQSPRMNQRSYSFIIFPAFVCFYLINLSWSGRAADSRSWVWRSTDSPSMRSR